MIANPIYDTFFKYLLQDEAATVCLLSSVLDQEILSVEYLNKEHAGSSFERPELSVIRFDFLAMIQQENGIPKKTFIELQKIRRVADIGRFRQYLANNYAKPGQVGHQEVYLPIITIYLLGFELEVDNPIVKVGGICVDGVTHKDVKALDHFIDSLTHQAYFIQIPRLSPTPKSRIERVLTLFNQKWVQNIENKRVLECPDTICSSENRVLIDRLVIALDDQVLQQNAAEEESFDKILIKELEEEFEKGRDEGQIEGIIKTAYRMKTAGISLQQIAQFTGLSVRDIEKIR